MKESDEKKNTNEVRKKESETKESYELEKKKDTKESDEAAKNDVEHKEDMKQSEDKSVGNDSREKEEKGNELKKEETSEESTSEESTSEESTSKESTDEESDESNKTDRKETISEVTGGNIQRKGGSRMAPDQFNCFYCEQTFSTPNSLRYHLDYVHPWKASFEEDSETKNKDVSLTKEIENKKQEDIVDIRNVMKPCMDVGVMVNVMKQSLEKSEEFLQSRKDIEDLEVKETEELTEKRERKVKRKRKMKMKKLLLTLQSSVWKKIKNFHRLEKTIPLKM